MDFEKRNELKERNILHETDAECILTTDGYVVESTMKALNLYGYKHIDEVKGFHVSIVFPDDFAKLFPGLISREHLTPGKYVQRVHKKKNGDLFPIKFFMKYHMYNGEKCVLVRIKKAPHIGVNEIKELQLRQQIELLKHELNHEKNLRLKMESYLQSPRQKSLYENKNIDFELITRISKRYSHLTPGDLRICSLLFINMNSKEIADFLCVSTESVFSARKRLRKKLNLKSTENLVKFICEQFSQ